MMVITLCYMPGLDGGYVFDDEVNILQNKQLRLGSLGIDDLRAAAMSGNAGPLGRPVALVSFALNLYTTGEDPYYFKITNLLIHLSNTLLVGLLAATLIRALSSEDSSEEQARSRFSGWLAAALWGLHPLNLTSVLYVVQRMTSLSALFGFLALLLYARLRLRQMHSGELEPMRTGVIGVFIVLLLTGSALSKESGLLFAPLLLWVEYLVFGFRLGSAPIKIGRISLQTLVSSLLVVSGALVVCLVLPRLLGPGSYDNRDFTLKERALTEARVLLYYLRLLLLPRSTELSLYHDDIEISRGLFDPPSTVISGFVLVFITLAVIHWRKVFPIALFGWGWFLISHSLESTIFPLELVHEHRNYFATIGLCMLIPVAVARLRDIRRVIALSFLALYIAFLGFVTLTRAQQWSSYVDLALLEASNHPRSARANYELGRTYLALLETTGESRFGVLAEQALRAATESYQPGLGSYFGLIHLAYYRGIEPDPKIVSALKEGLRTLPFYNGNPVFLQSFLLCQVDQRCKMPDQEAIAIFSAALENPRIRPAAKGEVYKQLAQYYINRTGDLNKGIELIWKAVSTIDQAPARIMLAQAYGMKGAYADAVSQLDRATELDRVQVYSRLIQRERLAIEEASKPRQSP